MSLNPVLLNRTKNLKLGLPRVLTFKDESQFLDLSAKYEHRAFLSLIIGLT